ncbi:hypothetical protein PAECIP112173_00095 [Paenibacillus sp. JJ-100]|uniref:DUF1349 domain-containing protein n=1 Tax=Paenibacillus sp. JJ-100 TaxID=2974896 RepID=UPI0022FF6DEA|nr:hypothetical protein PAECIP112173_00095 [Paenibacillus sp. JJ-100]
MKELVEISDYDPKWVDDYLAERAKIMSVLGDICLEMEHIGSTSVPGLGAKSVIDMMAGVSDLCEVQQNHINSLATLGYEYVHKPEFPERLFFRKGQWRAGTHHLHVYQYQGEAWKNQLRFRDALRHDSCLLQAYDTLKRELAQQFTNDRVGYTNAKSSFIQSVIKNYNLRKEVLIMNLFEHSSGKRLSKDLEWLNEPEDWCIKNGEVCITVPPASDFFIDPAGAAVKESAPFLHTTITGDFSITTQVQVEMKEQYDSGCLMVRASNTIWSKVCFEYFEEQPSILSVVTRGHSDDCVSAPVNVTKPYLRIARTGHSFAFHYSQDGEKWKLVRYFRMECPEEVQVGVVAQSPIGEGTRVTFSNVRLQQGLEGSILQVE